MISTINDQAEWDSFITAKGGHPLQLWGWGRVKEQHGPWRAHRLQLGDGAGAQVLVRSLPRPFKAMAYIPRGPAVADPDDRAAVLVQLSNWAKEQGCVELKIEPDWPAEEPLP
jgi:lipid II:glycine glycyltransferase (peptidoglycan interpeptide bridge formation enzyme)